MPACAPSTHSCQQNGINSTHGYVLTNKGFHAGRPVGRPGLFAIDIIPQSGYNQNIRVIDNGAG
jgi:hypothetical protein